MNITRNKKTALVAALLAAAATVAAGQAWAGGVSSSDESSSDGDTRACETPSQVLDLSNWRLTLPTGEEGDPDDVDQPELDSFVQEPYFTPTEDCEGVQFQAPVNGVTTENSKNPRSELREMDGEEEAAWSSTEGTHTMVVKEAFTQLPEPGDEDRDIVVGAQIHGGDDDFTVFRLERDKLWITDKDTTHGTLADENYELGTPFEAKYVVSDGKTEVYYNGELIVTYEEEYDGAYFKAGAYTQANCENSEPCDDGNFGQTEIYSLEVTHE